jgi:hypothetical protein
MIPTSLLEPASHTTPHHKLMLRHLLSFHLPSFPASSSTTVKNVAFVTTVKLWASAFSKRVFPLLPFLFQSPLVSAVLFLSMPISNLWNQGIKPEWEDAKNRIGGEFFFRKGNRQVVGSFFPVALRPKPLVWALMDCWTTQLSTDNSDLTTFLQAWIW